MKRKENKFGFSVEYLYKSKCQYSGQLKQIDFKSTTKIVKNITRTGFDCCSVFLLNRYLLSITVLNQRPNIEIKTNHVSLFQVKTCGAFLFDLFHSLRLYVSFSLSYKLIPKT